jgi:phosphoglycolate phosphatase
MSDRSSPAGLQAVIFDFDGTLVDSYEAIAASVNHVRSCHGLPSLPTDEVRRHVGRGPVNLLRQTVPDPDIEQDLARYRAHHPSVLRSGTRLLPGVAEILPILKSAGLRLGICSNKPAIFTRQLLEILNLTTLIDAVVGPEDAPRIKPAPDMLLAILSSLGVRSDEALYVGDMVVDIETGRAAGVPVWVVPTGSDTPEALRAAQPDRMLSHFADLTGLAHRGVSRSGRARPFP